METTPTELKKIENFPLSEIPPGNKVIVAYQPNEGDYKDRKFVLDYIVPDNTTSCFVEDVSGVPGLAVYTQIVEVLPNNKTRELLIPSQEFQDVFREAIEKNKGTVLVKPDNTLVGSLDEAILRD